MSRHRANKGTRSSPIIVDDSEEEVLLELCNASTTSATSASTSASNVPQPSSPDSLPQAPLLDTADGLNMSTSNNAAAVITFDAPQHTSQKRKREPVDYSDAFVQGSSTQSMPQAFDLRSSLIGENKKQRKRRKRLERQAMEAEMAAHAQRQQRWYNEMSTVLLDPASVPHPSAGWPGSHGFDSYNAPSNAVHPIGDDLMFPYTSYNYAPEPESRVASDWVSAMTLAGSLPNPTPLEDYSNQHQWTPSHYTPPTPALSPPALLERVSSPPRVIPLAPSHAGLPKKPPPPLNIIGMNPEFDPNSKHGVYRINSRHLSYFTPDSNRNSANGKGNYMPNPACTLVMEQLPKAHRTIEFVKLWAKGASGALPVCIFIDVALAKALVEFPSSKWARKAWESPRMGGEYAGLKPHQLKGRPRLDLIKVWWYRVDGIGAGAGVGEIEEGEIEDDALDRPMTTMAQSESKKARKARLAREKQANKALTSPLQGRTSLLRVVPEPLHPQRYGLVDSPFSTSHPDAGSADIPQRTISPTTCNLKGTAQNTDIQSSVYPTWEYSSNDAREDLDSIASSRDLASRLQSPAQEELKEVSTDAPAPLIDLPARRASTTDEMLILEPHPIPHQRLVGQTVNAAVAEPQNLPAAVIDSDPSSPSPSLSPLTPTVSSPQSILTASSQQVLSSHSQPSQPPIEWQANKESGSLLEMKQSLLARQKELEQKIAKSKMEMGRLASLGPITTPLESEGPTESRHGTTAPLNEDNHAMENRLRNLVLKSQKAKAKPVDNLATTHSSSAATRQEPPTVAANQPSMAIPKATTPTLTYMSSVQSFSLEDLAVSFITETIQTLKNPAKPLTPSGTASNGPPVPRAPSRSNVKDDLAAKQKRLEQYIAESKELMFKLTQAGTKQEKDQLLALMRQKTRLMDEEKMASSRPLSPSPKFTSQQLTKQASHSAPKTKWPTASRDAGILIISDDEDDEDEDE
ncbi:hypothetical protein AX17_004649 [Amanita inopinata Kibby_2008]|nr:hypothetical protein AX17_004649 [Amanita inopinata Kibby_2008]